MRNCYQTAHDVYSGRLYHYEKFSPQWLEATLRDKRIRCSNPAKLNDPWDCRISLDCADLLRDPAEREKLLSFYRDALPPESLKHPGRARFEDLVRTDDAKLIEMLQESSRLLTEQLQLRRIYCLTPHPLSTLMWSHYAGDHAGICLEFHIGNSLFVKAQGVKYETQYPRLTLTHANSENVLAFILTKAACWSYEEEFRLIASPKFPEGLPLKLHDGDYLKLPDRALLSVIVGCNGDYDAVKNIVENYAPEVRVIKVRRAPNEYNLMMGLV